MKKRITGIILTLFFSTVFLTVSCASLIRTTTTDSSPTSPDTGITRTTEMSVSPSSTSTEPTESTQPTTSKSLTNPPAVTSFSPTPPKKPPVSGASPIVAFTRFTNNSWDEQIFTIRSDGTGLIQLTRENNVQEHFPRFSPDGIRIVFGRCEKDGSFDVYLMNRDGSGRINLTNSPGRDDMPSWSPDGSQIAFISSRAYSSQAYSDVYIMAKDGSGVKRLTYDTALDWVPVWSPDGSQIAFLSNRDGKWKWWVMNADGSNQHLLADIEIYDGTVSVPVVVLQGCWSRVFLEGKFFTPLLTKSETHVISIDTAEGKRWAMNLTDVISISEAPDGALAATHFSTTTNSYDLVYWPADAPSHVITSGSEHDVVGSCWSPPPTVTRTPEPSQSGVPKIDGIISPGEWDNALEIDYTLWSIGPAAVPCKVYITHDVEKIYVAVTFTWGTITQEDSLTIHFDNDGAGGPRVTGDDVIQLSTFFSDMYVESVGSTPETGIGIRPDTMAGGQTDGYGIRTTDGTNTTYELWHPLDSSDSSHDFSLNEGSTFGFTILLRVGSTQSSIPSGWMIKTDDYTRLIMHQSTFELKK